MKRSSEPSEGAVDHRRRVLGVVVALVREAKALRHLQVELDRSELPTAPE